MDMVKIRHLQCEGRTVEEIAERLGLNPFELAITLTPMPFTLTERLFEMRRKKNLMRFGEDCLERYCQRCDDFLPYTREFFNCNKAACDGCYSHCRACERERARGKREERKTAVSPKLFDFDSLCRSRNVLTH
ncbi:hypothetical protein [uncultured Photobacterium sp.]|uniref:hypothetical protein n=1 Tax=uncultured Photobacterium sp. TaxID=173973 RepID=UPI0026382287|nr:hypothetical protein [uncultured Photobacterium sp.]